MSQVPQLHAQVVKLGTQNNGLIIKSGFASDLYIQNELIHMYSDFGELGVARVLFDKMPYRDAVSWTSMIDWLVNYDLPIEAMDLFERMLEAGIEVNDATGISVLRACVDLGALGVGRKVYVIVCEGEEN